MMVQKQQESEASVLVVEDNTLNQEFMVEILSEYNAKVDIANNGAEAIDKVISQNNHYDLILMDIQMPVMDGFLATKKIRKTISKDNLPIIAVTAHASIADREKCLSSGMNDYVAKPINIKNIKEIISSYIDPDHEIDDIHPIETIELAGMDFSESLSRVDNDLSFLSDLLDKFISKYENICEDLLQLIDDNKLTQAADLVHGLKGVSGNLALNDIYLLSKKVEQCIKDNETQAIDSLLTILRQKIIKINQARTDLHNHINSKKPDADKSNDNNSLLSEAISNVLELLKNNNFEALDKFLIIKDELLKNSNNETVNDIENDILNLEFKQAAKKLSTL